MLEHLAVEVIEKPVVHLGSRLTRLGTGDDFAGALVIADVDHVGLDAHETQKRFHVELLAVQPRDPHIAGGHDRQARSTRCQPVQPRGIARVHVNVDFFVRGFELIDGVPEFLKLGQPHADALEGDEDGFDVIVAAHLLQAIEQALGVQGLRRREHGHGVRRRFLERAFQFEMDYFLLAGLGAGG